MAGLTLSQKLWESHVVQRAAGELDQLYVDLHLVHEVSSPQAFDGLRLAGRRVRRPDLTVATEDHDVPTDGLGLRDPLGRAQIEALRGNCKEFDVPLYPQGTASQGIVHVIGPELGLTQPGMVVACGDSHTSTHGAFGALGIGIGTSEVEHVLATQTLVLPRPRTFAVNVTGQLPLGSSAKDLVLALIAQVGMGGGQGHIAEYRGEGVRALSMEARMTLCNMSVEWSARAGVVAPDEVTIAYVAGRPHAASGAAWDNALAAWARLHSDDDAVFDREITIDASAVSPQVTWGTNPSQAVPLSGAVPDPDSLPVGEQDVARRALDYMGLTPGTQMRSVPVDAVFIGSCTNGRLEDLRSAAEVFRGRKTADGVTVLVVPGSRRVKAAAESEGLDRIFTDAGAQWRDPGCSMCLGMNSDVLAPGLRSASTSNRNFEGRQGPHARTHLVSPAVAAATAVVGRLSSPADLT